MSTENTNEDKAPPSVEDTLNLFFGETNQKKIDLGNGRPKKDNKETKNKEKKKNKGKEDKKESKREALVNEFQFYKRFNKKLQERSDIELRQKAARAKRKVEEDEKNLKKELRSERLKELQKKIGHPQKVNSKTCDHTLVVNYMAGGVVSVTCSKCSMTKRLLMKEWLVYNITQNKTKFPTENPNRAIFPI